MRFSPQYYYDKFASIPKDRWTTGQLSDGEGRHDALGHLGATEDPESYRSKEIQSYLRMFGATRKLPSAVHDGRDPDYPQEHPRDRVLALLVDLGARAKEVAA